MQEKNNKQKEKHVNYSSTLNKNEGKWHNRILIATPTTGLVRMEWVHAKQTQIIPTNWSQVDLTQWMNSYVPLQYLLPDAQNLVAKEVIEKDFEWLLFIEEDNIIPNDAFVRINEYMMKGDIPYVSALYFTKSNPPEPVLYRGRGNGSFRDFKIGDKVWVDGVPFGLTLIHSSIIKAAWEESPEYSINGQITRRVFNQPVRNWSDDRGYGAVRGTTDLEWCSRIMNDKLFEKAGWPEYQKKKYPFLIDTNLFCWHVDQMGRKYPLGGIPSQYIRKNK